MKKLEVKLSDEHMTKLDAIVTEWQRHADGVVSRACIVRIMIDTCFMALQNPVDASDAEVQQS